MIQTRLHSEQQLTQKEIEENQARLQAFRSRCLPIFERLKLELIQTHHNWYIAIEPDSGNYFIAKDELEVCQMAHLQHPQARIHVFRINETGVCGTI